MRDFRQGDRGGFNRRPGGNRFGGGRRDFNRGPTEMFNTTCSNCGKVCQVPFKPTGSKPVFCSDCFRKNNESGRSSSGSGMSGDQIAQINTKLDKILKLLQELEIDTGEEEDFEDSEESDDDSEEEN